MRSVSYLVNSSNAGSFRGLFVWKHLLAVTDTVTSCGLRSDHALKLPGEEDKTSHTVVKPLRIGHDTDLPKTLETWHRKQNELLAMRTDGKNIAMWKRKRRR